MGKIFKYFDSCLERYITKEIPVDFDINSKPVEVGERVMFTKASPGGISYGTIQKIVRRKLNIDDYVHYTYFYIKTDKGRETVKTNNEIIKL